ncbi:MAG: 2-dehydropantoate 2-reductase [Candidatus Limiplasma sp.]|nr:2-dehydropantoate 2-reductase [Candidatus Limiplasma sp.]
MSNNPLRIVVVGAGGIGGITAALLKKAAQDVTLVCKHPDIAALTSQRGLHVTGIKGEFTIPVPAVAEAGQLEGTFDVALIATKAYDMAAAAEALLPFLRPDSLVLSLQNGICTDALAEVVGKARTVGCVVGYGATMHAPAELEMTSTGAFIIGRIEGDPSALHPVRDVLNHVVETTISHHIFADLYSKLIVNSCITSLGAICGLRLGEMLKRRKARSIFLAIIAEAMSVAHALTLDVPPYGGKLDYEKLMQGDRVLDHLRRHVTIFLVGLKYKNLKSSSLQSLERGRPTEIDYFNGYIAQKGESLGVDCPVNRRLTAMVKEIERGERTIKVENLDDAQ